MFSFLVAFLLPLATAFAAEAPVFVLSCDKYPDVCDTHCFALACASAGGTNFRDVNRYIHYAPDSSTMKPNPGHDTTEDTYRRQAIGCANSDCASKFPGYQCDEFPYASTYDGGLGCITNRYRGHDAIAISGVNHCANGQHNARHGSDLKNFYRTQGLSNGARFQLAFDEATVDHALGCKIIRAGGAGVCGQVRSATGEYNVRTRNDLSKRSYCPGNRRRRRATLTSYDDNSDAIEEAEPAAEESAIEPAWDGYVNMTWTRSVDAHGNLVLFPFREDAPPAMTRVFHVKRDGTQLQSHIL